MSTAPVTSRTYKPWQLIVFAASAVLIAAFFAVFFGGAPSLLSPWILLGETATSTYHPEIHRWHDAVWGVITTFLFAASLLALVWKGYKRPLIAQFFALAVFLFILVTLPFPGGFDPNRWQKSGSQSALS